MGKSTTGIAGFDSITGGGLPAGRTTLVEGGTGSGKTVFSLQTLVHGVLEDGEPGIFVCFEENSRRILANASGFGWDMSALGEDRLCFVDARPEPDLVHTGEMDIAGLLAGLDARVKAMGARRIVFDAVDAVMALVNNPAVVRREMFRLQHWLNERELTAIVTSKITANAGAPTSLPLLDFMPFAVDCLVRLDHAIVEGMSQRDLRVCKYRGSAFEENALPMVFGAAGIEVAYFATRGETRVAAGTERLSSGLSSLDQMLGGGYFRGSGVLVTGSPGTAKTTLAGAFARAACARGERALFVSFDSRADEIVRNLESVDIRLAPLVDAGTLEILSLRALSGNAESAMLRIRARALRMQATCLVADPLSALSKSGNRAAAPGVAERLIEWAKSSGLTVFCTCLPDEADDSAGTPLQVSTIADTWINLTYVVNAGERNRGLSIIKSRGTSHSNQVRELVLSDEGATLSDVYTAGGEVLMGSLRWTREREHELAAVERAAEAAREHMRLRNETAEIEAQLSVLQRKLEAARQQEEALGARNEALRKEREWTQKRLHARRSGEGDDR